MAIGLRRSGSWSQIIDQAQDFPEQFPRHRYLGQLQSDAGAKLAMGHPDLYSGRSQVDLDWLAGRLGELGAGQSVRQEARGAAFGVLDGETRVEVLIFDRRGKCVGRAYG